MGKKKEAEKLIKQMIKEANKYKIELPRKIKK